MEKDHQPMLGNLMRNECARSESHSSLTSSASTLLSYWEPCVTCAIDMIRLTDDYMTTPMHLSVSFALCTV